MRRMNLGATAANLIFASNYRAFAFITPTSRSSFTSHKRLGTPPAASLLHDAPIRCGRRRRYRHHCAALASSSSSDDNVGGSSSISSSFESLGLSDDLIAVTQKMKWDVPTPVQQLSIPAILDMAGDDGYDNEEDGGSSLWAEGPTGSGKTGGFALPLLQILLHQKRNKDHYEEQIIGRGKISTLVLCPTRELASQIGTVLQRLTSYLPNNKHRRQAPLTIDVIYGGVPMEPQVARLARKRRSGENIDVLVATPGRLVDVLKRNGNDDDPTLSALERRIMDAFDDKSMSREEDWNSGGKKKRKKGKGGNRRRGPPVASSLTLNEIQEMDLDRVDDDGRATLDEMLHQLDYLVVDEADRLLGGAFKEEMDELLSLFPPKDETKLKTLLFSATFPEQIEERVDRVLSRMSAGTPLRVSTSAAMLQRVGQEGGDDSDEDAGLSNRQKKHLANTTPIQNVLPDTAPKIQHRVIRLAERDRTQALRYLLEHDEDGAMDRVLVFVGTRYLTEHVSRKLRRYGIAAADLHGKLDQEARERRLAAFRTGKTRVLIATDLAARGIDVENLPAVVNFDLPRSAADFTHRTGRTGRAGKTGLAVSFVSAKSESHFNFIEKKEMGRGRGGGGGQRIKREVLPGFEPEESLWKIESAAATMSVPGAMHSQKGLEHDKIFGGVKGRRKSKKDKLREAAAAKAAREK
eukprot:CAMPEP_0183751330 /NCGR_PEP_ID=MMETSP0739-20130205/1682_1 /TAXON_ID=385413 /ORGANISM="Thalassiosira miniscula, Strain CCMP1093" /LENGTH=691 /DNA_ID=CAMNT_0025987551 /DNA_START=60 /DNA_END=2135 /DNA_ORIENTATION=-